jgi:hypothetical protein
MRTKRRAGAPSDYSTSPPPRLSRSTPLRGLCALLLLAPWAVMAQRFDVVTFDAPPGWTQQALADELMFETRPAGTLCQIILRNSRAPTGSLLQELDREWSELGEPPRKTPARDPTASSGSLETIPNTRATGA